MTPGGITENSLTIRRSSVRGSCFFTATNLHQCYKLDVAVTAPLSPERPDLWPKSAQVQSTCTATRLWSVIIVHMDSKMEVMKWCPA